MDGSSSFVEPVDSMKICMVIPFILNKKFQRRSQLTIPPDSVMTQRQRMLHPPGYINMSFRKIHVHHLNKLLIGMVFLPVEFSVN
jgi:hypothetical protein